MDDRRFYELLAGPLHHPLCPLERARLAQALRYVVEMTGYRGEKALEEWCELRQRADDSGGEAC